jgi:hypothetical protein
VPTAFVTSKKNPDTIPSKIIRKYSVEPMSVDRPDPFILIVPEELDDAPNTSSRLSRRNSGERMNVDTTNTSSRLSRRNSGKQKNVDAINTSSRLSRKNSEERMNIDDEDIHNNLNDDYFKSYSSNKSEAENGPYLTTNEFNYTMSVIDEKIGSLYKLCRFISETQQENKKALKKLVALDELSDVFWNVSYLFSNFIIFKYLKYL